MSRVGNRPSEIPEGVTVNLSDKTVNVSGPKGELSFEIPHKLSVKVEDGQIVVARSGNAKPVKALHGLYARLLRNATIGVSKGWNKELELVGTGYRANVQGKKLVLAIGFSHPVEIEAPETISFEVFENTKITVSGSDRHLVGQVAANIRKVRPPEPYQGKGIKYAGEYIRRKAGKSAKAAVGAT